MRRTSQSYPRQIRNLSFAQLSPTGPWAKSRLRGSKAKGIAYERRVQRKLKEMVREGSLSCSLFPSQWIEFYDENGRGWAQPDIYGVGEDWVLLVECKLTQQEWGYAQMNNLYRPLLEWIYKRPVLCLQAAHNLIYSNRLCSPQERISLPEGFWTWHFLR